MRILAVLLASLALLGAPDAKVEARLKEVARLQGVRANQLLGYGVVVGLDGTGDKDQTKFTVQSLTNLMARQGITIDPKSVKVKNVAAVMVTAELPPFVKPGQRIDVTVSSTGDAKSRSYYGDSRKGCVCSLSTSISINYSLGYCKCLI